MPFRTATRADQLQSGSNANNRYPGMKPQNKDGVSHSTTGVTFSTLHPSSSISSSTISQSNPYRLELNMLSLDLEQHVKAPQPAQLQSNHVQMDSPLARPVPSLKSSHDQNIKPSAFYARFRSTSDDQRQKSVAAATSSSSSTSLIPVSHQLELELGGNDSFSAELEAFIFDSKPVSTSIESKQSNMFSSSPSLNNTEPCHTIKQTNSLATSTLFSSSTNCGTTVDPTAQPRCNTSTASTAHVSAISANPNSAGQTVSHSPISTLSKTMTTMPQATINTNTKINTLPTTTTATTKVTDLRSSTLPSSSSSSKGHPLSSTFSFLINSKLDTERDLPSIPISQQNLNNSGNISHIMTYPSPPLQSAMMPTTADKNIQQSDVVSSSIEIHTINISQPQSQPAHIVTPTVSYTTITDSDEEVDDDSAPSTVSLSDCAHSSPHISSSPSSSHKNDQLHDNLVSLNKAVASLQLTPTSENDLLKPIPQKSEDWAALIDTPASPTRPQYPNMMPRPLLAGYSTEGYTDSPAPEEGTAYGPPSDYMQHVPQQQQYYQQQQQYGQSQQQQQYPYPHHNLPYQHQYHNSTSSVPLTHHRGMSSSDGPDMMACRKSWSASETMNGTGYNSYGYLTPPRHPDDNNRSRPGSSLGMRQGPVATSVSLLTDAAILAKYRETAIKTNDPSIQLSYAKYLLEIGESSIPSHSTSSPSSSSTDIRTPRPSFAASSNSPPPSSPPSPTSAHHDTDSGKRQLTLEATYWIDRLAKEGQAEAQFIRASWYEDGLYNSKRNVDKALRWYQSASRGDYGPAHYKVAYYCERKKDNNKAVMLYKKAAVHNEAPANHRLAMIYLNGELGQSKNLKAGLEYLKRAATFATETAPKAPYVLGLILAREYGDQLAIPDDIAFPDDGEALEWFRKSALLGYGPANYKLGYCYEYGSLGCNVDPFLSVHHYERAVKAGDSKGEAEMALSGWYLSGAENCFQTDDQLAFKFASIAAEKNLPKAQYAMGYYYEVGISVPADSEKAMEFYKLAAGNGNKDAIKRLQEQSTNNDKLAYKNSIKKIKQNRNSKDQSFFAKDVVEALKDTENDPLQQYEAAIPAVANEIRFTRESVGNIQQELRSIREENRELIKSIGVELKSCFRDIFEAIPRVALPSTGSSHVGNVVNMSGMQEYSQHPSQYQAPLFSQQPVGQVQVPTPLWSHPQK
ncbi:hypothetical protein BGX27_007517, partial [Mortierella sp. AM989]